MIELVKLPTRISNILRALIKNAPLHLQNDLIIISRKTNISVHFYKAPKPIKDITIPKHLEA